MRFVALFLLSVACMVAAAQTAAPPENASKVPTAPTKETSNSQAAVELNHAVTVPAGTKVLLQLKSPISTKSAHVGDTVYCQTSFPVTQDNIVVIPAGTYVKGEIAQVQRPGRIKGRAQILFHFNSMIFPDGYTVDLPGALKSQPGATNSSVSDDEGTVKADSQKGRDVGTVASTGATGAVVGTVAAHTGRGAAIGGLAGAAVGLGEVLLTRGQEVRIEQGTALEMVLQRPLTVEVSNSSPALAADAENDLRPHLTNTRRLPAPKRRPLN